MTPTPAFSLTSVSKRFGRRPALQDVSLEVQQGGFLLLLGDNGAGKSTLLRILSTLMRPSSGEVRFEGEVLPAAGPAVRQAVGVVSHESRLYGDLTARENLRVFGTLYGVRGLREATGRALAEMRLEEAADVPARAFSSGMLKRLALARVLLYGPRVLLLDEPYAGLDQASVALLDAFLARFRAGGGTCVLVTHQFAGGVEQGDRIAILHRGRLVYNQPAQGVTAAHCAELLQAHAGAAPGA